MSNEGAERAGQGGVMNRSPNDWRTIWAIWVVYFCVAEWFALKSKNQKAPLSYFMRTTLGIRRKPVHRRAGQVAFGAGIVWLISHLYNNADE